MITVTNQMFVKSREARRKSREEEKRVEGGVCDSSPDRGVINRRGDAVAGHGCVGWSFSPYGGCLKVRHVAPETHPARSSLARRESVVSLSFLRPGGAARFRLASSLPFSLFQGKEREELAAPAVRVGRDYRLAFQAACCESERGQRDEEPRRAAPPPDKHAGHAEKEEGKSSFRMPRHRGRIVSFSKQRDKDDNEKRKKIQIENSNTRQKIYVSKSKDTYRTRDDSKNDYFLGRSIWMQFTEAISFKRTSARTMWFIRIGRVVQGGLKVPSRLFFFF